MCYPIIKVFLVTLVALCMTLEGYATELPPGYGAEPYRQHPNTSYYELSQYAGEMLSSNYAALYAHLNETLYYLKEQGVHRDIAPLLVVTLSLFTYQIRQHQARLFFRAYMQSMNNRGNVNAVAATTAAVAA